MNQKEQLKVLIDIPNGQLRSRLSTALQCDPGMTVLAAGEDDRSGNEAGLEDVVLLSMSSYTTALPYSVAEEREKRGDPTVILVYKLDLLLELSAAMKLVDGWIPYDRLMPVAVDLVRLARHQYAVLPPDLDLEAGLDALRRQRFKRLPAHVKNVLGVLAEGAVNREIARQTGMAVGKVNAALRIAFRKLCFRNRLEAAVFIWRLKNKPDWPGSDPETVE